MNLEFGSAQHYMGLKYHMEEALQEHGQPTNTATANPPIAIFARGYYDDINRLDHTNIHDYCFIGSINSCVRRRRWVLEFVKKHFTKDSVFVNTDIGPGDTWTPLGVFDYSTSQLGYCPKIQPNNQSRPVQYRPVSENVFYFQTMTQSKYTLCPAGDSAWSFRFYEALMCKSVPIVESWHHTYRTREEAAIPYHYVLYTDIAKQEDVSGMEKTNTELFQQFHLLH
jgi:hypothetical protein